MPLPVIGLATTGFQLVKKAQLGKRAGSALKKGFTFLKDRAKTAKFAATEKGFTLTGDGFSAQGGQAVQGTATRPYMAAGSTSYLPYLVGGALLLMFLKK